MDLSDKLNRSTDAALRSAWDEGHAGLVVVVLLLSRSDLVVDWDRAAGESWIRLLDGDDVVTLVSVKRPLVLTRRGRAELPTDLVDRLELVEAASLEGVEFTCSSDALDTAFPGASSSPAIDLSGFSLMDLWYVTV